MHIEFDSGFIRIATKHELNAIPVESVTMKGDRAIITGEGFSLEIAADKLEII